MGGMAMGSRAEKIARGGGWNRSTAKELASGRNNDDEEEEEAGGGDAGPATLGIPATVTPPR